MEQGQEIGGLRRRATRTILAAGNDRASLNALARRLGNLGHLVVLGTCGSQALELIAGRGFDLVLLEDDGDGAALHVLREIRGMRDAADLPVILVAADSPQVLAGLIAGADDSLARPYDFEHLAARMERMMARAARVDELKRSNLAIDARIAARAIELGELRTELAATRAERARLIAAIRDLNTQLERAGAA